jgi:hypothetical protein
MKVHFYTEEGGSLFIRIIIDYLPQYKEPGHRSVLIVILYIPLNADVFL